MFYLRSVGAAMMMMSFMSARAANFLREEDKKSVLLSHAFVSTQFIWFIGLLLLVTFRVTIRCSM